MLHRSQITTARSKRPWRRDCLRTVSPEWDLAARCWPLKADRPRGRPTKASAPPKGPWRRHPAEASSCSRMNDPILPTDGPEPARATSQQPEPADPELREFRAQPRGCTPRSETARSPSNHALARSRRALTLRSETPQPSPRTRNTMRRNHPSPLPRPNTARTSPDIQYSSTRALRWDFGTMEGPCKRIQAKIRPNGTRRSQATN